MRWAESKPPGARREELLDQFERSGLRGQKFTELAGIKYQTFASWVQKRRRQRGGYPAVKAPNKAADQVLEALVEEAQSVGGKQSLALLLELPVVGAEPKIKDSKLGSRSCGWGASVQE